MFVFLLMEQQKYNIGRNSKGVVRFFRESLIGQ